MTVTPIAPARRHLRRKDYPATTPGGARIMLTGRRWILLDVDYWATGRFLDEAQVRATQQLVQVGVARLFAAGYRHGMSYGAGRAGHSLSLPVEDVADHLAAVYSIEAHDFDAAARICDRWLEDPATARYHAASQAVTV